MKWHGRFIDTKEPRTSKHIKRTIFVWELSECGQWVIITSNNVDAPRRVMHQSEFARNVNIKRYKYTDMPQKRFILK